MKKIVKQLNKKATIAKPKKGSNSKANKTLKELDASKYQYKGHFPSRTWAKPSTKKGRNKGPRI